MSEEKLTKLEEMEIQQSRMDKEISELEKKLAHIEEYYIEEGIGERIEKLEQKFKHQCDNCQILMEDRVKELAELRQTNKHQSGQLAALKTQINELKEQIKYKKTCNALMSHMNEKGRPDEHGIGDIREVLREHHKGHLRVYDMIDSVDKPVDKMWKRHLEEQISKLDGSKSFEYDYNKGAWEKDGEKSDEVHSGVMRVGEQGGDNRTSEDSKPPKEGCYQFIYCSECMMDDVGCDKKQ